VSTAVVGWVVCGGDGTPGGDTHGAIVVFRDYDEAVKAAAGAAGSIRPAVQPRADRPAAARGRRRHSPQEET
jgi:hypothetical protein